MSLRPDNHYHCDGCGHDLGPSAGMDVAAIISDTATTKDGASVPARYDLCRSRTEEGKRVKGCRERVLTPKALRDWTAHQEASA